jgi:uncharacterized membrane protein
MNNEKIASLKTVTTVIYALQAASFILPFTVLVGIIMNYVKRDEVQGTWLASHFRWQIRTFWFALLWTVIGSILAFVVVGFIVLGINAVWVIYRIVKGWLRLVDGKEMYLA